MSWFWIAVMTAASPSSQAKALEALAASLVALEKKAVASDGLGDVPGWVVADGPGGLNWRPAPAPVDDDTRAQLAAIVRGRGRADVRGLAGIRLAAAREPDDLPVLEALLGSSDPAFHRPAIHLTQQVQMRYPVDWTPLTIEQAGLLALSTVVGKRFHDAAAYRAWTKDNGDLARSFDFQEQRLKGMAPKERLAALLRIRAKDRTLCWRLVVHNSVSPGFGIGDDELLPLLAKDYGPTGIAKILREEEKWPEHERSFQTFVRFVLDRGEHVFAGDGKKTFRALFDDRDLAMHRYQRGGAAVVLSRLFGDRGLEILRDASIEKCDAKVLAETVRRYSPAEDERIAADYFACGETAQGECLAAIAERGAPARPLLTRLLADERFDVDDPNLVARAVQAARKLGAPEFEREREIYARFRKGGFQDPAAAKAAEADAKAARRDTLRRLRAWLEAPSR